MRGKRVQLAGLIQPIRPPSPHVAAQLATTLASVVSEAETAVTVRSDGAVTVARYPRLAAQLARELAASIDDLECAGASATQTVAKR